MRLALCEFSGCNGVELVTENIRAVVISDRGPRLAYFGRPEGPNLLLWAPGKYFEKNWEMLGGHRIWFTRPLADESEEVYAPDALPCEVERLDNGWIVRGAEDARTRTRRGIAIRSLDEKIIDVEGFLTNTGDMLTSGGIWAITCTVPGDSTRYGIPLGDGNMWEYFNLVMFRKWDGHSGGYHDEQFSFTDEMMIIEPNGKENKRMIQAPKGIFAMNDPARDILFVKKAPYTHEGTYPNGCNLAVYTGPDSFTVEMESMGPQRLIKPGETICHNETWLLESSHARLDAETLGSLF